ncbi:HNH endonuclease [Knoellia aerolata]|uniref:HNH endonuclease n=1 Tax=Knoellia aerolata TaxID=442954 RepID=UPI0034E09198
MSLRPALQWRAVCKRAKQAPGFLWGTLDGGPAQDFLLALAKEVEESSDVSASEGERRDKLCRQRSRSNRIHAIERSLGKCEGCGLNLTQLFGSRGERGLEVHHDIPMHAGPAMKRVTSLEDLTVLCATCHRLLHADPDMSRDSLRIGWSMGRR